MKRQRRKTDRSFELIPGDPNHYLGKVVDFLNPTVVRTRCGDKENLRKLPLSETQKCLRLLVDNWKASGPNLRKMLEKEREIEAWVNRGKTILLTTTGGQGHLDWVPFQTQDRAISPQEQAMEYFLWLVVNPNWSLLGGPCPQCGIYFLKHSLRHNVYCSRKCSGSFTAAAAMRKRRELERQDDIRCIKSAIFEYRQRRIRDDWKDWVARRVPISKKMLTQAVDKDWIEPPPSSQSPAAQ